MYRCPRALLKGANGEEGIVRIVGVILVVLGACGLGWDGFTYATTDRVGEGGAAVMREKQEAIWVPPVVSGIAVVSGLILLASSSRREEL